MSLSFPCSFKYGASAEYMSHGRTCMQRHVHMQVTHTYVARACNVVSTDASS
jgi:hypothetical protein